MITKFIDKHPIISGLIALMIIPLFYIIWRVGADTANKFAGIFTPIIVAGVTIYLSNRQHNIADAQRAVAEENKNIAAANRDIADKKMKLELFEKRYEIYNSVVGIYSFALSLNKRPAEYIYGSTMEIDKCFFFNIDDKDKFKKALEKAKNDRIELDKQYEEKIISIEKSRFIFGEEVFHKFGEIISKSYKIGRIFNNDAIKNLENNISSLGNSITVIRNSHSIDDENIDEIIKFETYMGGKIQVELSKYLDISHI